MLQNRTGVCLDAEGGRIANGTRLIGYTCSGAPNQTFYYYPDQTLRMGGLCVDASGGYGRAGDQIVLWPCYNPPAPNQHWRAQNGLLIGINNQCLDLSGAFRAPLTNQPAILWPCNAGDANQLWGAWSPPPVYRYPNYPNVPPAPVYGPGNPPVPQPPGPDFPRGSNLGPH